MTPARKQTEPSTRPGPVLWHRTITALGAAITATVLTAASCGGTPAPAPPAVTYPKLPAAPIAYTLADPGPSRYQVVYQTGRLNLRKDTKETTFTIGFRDTSYFGPVTAERCGANVTPFAVMAIILPAHVRCWAGQEGPKSRTSRPASAR